MLCIEKSLVQASSLTCVLLDNYNITFNNILLLNTKINDTYKVLGNNISYLFKIYGSFVPYNLIAINDIISNYYNIKYIYKTKNNMLYINIKYPEGNRIEILYHYFEGKTVYNDPHMINLCGISLYNFHMSNNYNYSEKSIVKRYINLDNIFHKCHIQQVTKKYLLNMLDYTLNFDTFLLSDYDISYCHGDCHFNNFIFNNNNIYLIDFDDAHINYTLYDITHVIWTCFYQLKTSTNEILNFLYGYYKYQQFKPFLFKIIEYFFINIELFYLSNCLIRQSMIGINNINDKFINRRIDMLYDLSSYILKINDAMLNKKRRI